MSPSAEDLKLCLHIFYLLLRFPLLLFRWCHLGLLGPLAPLQPRFDYNSIQH